MAVEPLRVASLGIGWWSDVLADAINRIHLNKSASELFE